MLDEYRLVALGHVEDGKVPATLLRQRLQRWFDEDPQSFLKEMTALERQQMQVQARIKEKQADQDRMPTDADGAAERGEGDERLARLREEGVLGLEWEAIRVRLPKEPTGELAIQAVVVPPGGSGQKAAGVDQGKV